MAKFSYPGVYSERKKSTVNAPATPSVSTYAPVGWANEGPENEPTEVYTYREFTDTFGSEGPMAIQMLNFYKNGGGKALITRVTGAGAAKAGTFFAMAETGEAIAVSPLPDGTETAFVFVGTAAINELPIVPGSVVLSDGTVTFTDNGDGTLTGTGVGNTGTIDYLTGEGTLNYGVAPILGTTYTVDYSYKTFTFNMDWKGDAGNDFRVVISGDDAYYVSGTASFSRYVVTIERLNDTGTYDTLETFSGLSLTDPSDAKFITTVLNDTVLGSHYVDVVLNGHNEIPTGLNGVAVAAEVVVPVPVYDGSARAFDYVTANASSPYSVEMSLYPRANNENLGIPAGGAPTYNGTLGNLPDISVINSVEIIASTNGGTIETFVNSVAAGALVGDNGGTGTIDALGAFSITAGVGNVDAVRVNGNYKWATPIVVVDDGNGNLSVQSGGGTEWILDPNGTNEVDYDNGEISLTFRYVANPTVGPAAAHGTLPFIAWTQTVDYYAQPVSASVNAVMTGGLDGAALTTSDVTSAALSADETGIYALNKTDEVVMFDVPDFYDNYIAINECIDYVNSRLDDKNDRYFLHSAPHGLTAREIKNWFTNRITKSEFSACFVPHVKIEDPDSKAVVEVSPVGNVCGDHARTDNDVNPAQAAAGIQYGQLNCLGLERIFTENEVGSLYDVGVNCLVDWPNTGRVIWGCRNTEINGDLPFISMSRAYMAVNKLLVKTLYPYVFKSNTESLWNQIKLNVEAVLVGLHNSNWFAGKTPAESFEVICDKTNNNTANNYIEVEVGVAFQKPAEFIKLVIRQKLTSRS